MRFLENELNMYKKFLGEKFNIESLKKINGSKLNLGDIFVIYTPSFPIYGIVIDKSEDLNKCLYLTSELFLASAEAIRIKINHFANEVALTHIVFYISDDFAWNYCEVIGKFEDIKAIEENFEILNDEVYVGPRKEFFELETEKLVPLYDLFFKNVEDEISENEKIITIDVPKHLRETEVELLAAETKGVRGNNFVGIIKEKSLFIYPKDELIGKHGIVKFKGEIIYTGVISETLVIENTEGLVIQNIEKDLIIEVI
ncbi:hypothetical protein SU69_08450 [Thermosipho melanesiensis]|uniref:Uncharacterized protein n=2 Tax=Thermosipho melanesiensis TaxID=46541 RepID=A6LNK9_THEM4|nr:hypothetical protein [Thermosipho melanesiensis]ABR31510.1 hypothetical protein Tmel_1667 [Thermosipho melanesiensis BI429]APT74560.1 hypothetical protein BW47_08825 [Thermosipho melanesiensis]OOC35258.1 hypothetical protein SU69_08450 [Thermosipho melanesiensis]OOC35477.1 hypothetical protein SU70_08460 [Thermosipho melanesiensis]OOC36513.1 hypothetical protein SU68_08515 [Thermosipho melanesiensis]